MSMSEIVFGALGGSTRLPTETKGLDYSVLRPGNGGGATIFRRLAKGTRGAAHTHPGGEELFVVSGDITIGDRRVKAGDYLYTPPGAAHDAEARDDTVLQLSLPQLPVFV
jgi:quercetin dioxygenase-like cupin family protein